VSRNRHRTSVSAALMVSAGCVLAVVLVVLEVPLATSVSQRISSGFRSESVADAGQLAAQVAEPVGRFAAASDEQVQTGQDLLAAVKATADATGATVLIADRSLRIVATSTGRGRGTPLPAAVRALRSSLSARKAVVETSNGQLIVVEPVREAGQVVGAVQLVKSLAGVRGRVHQFWIRLVLFGLVALIFGLALARLLAGWLLGPLRRLESTARRFGSGDLAARADVGPQRELASLAESFNAMADELAANVRAQREFAANASHQLRTPLTGLRLRLEALQRGAPDLGTETSGALKDVDRLSRLTNDLLALSHASATPVAGRPVDLGEIAHSAVEHWSSSVARAGKSIELTLRQPATVLADADELEQMLDNLIDNAVRYSQDGARIEVEAHNATITVSDDGPGIDPAERQLVFERFYRGPSGRRAGPGTGLGLAIVAALAARWHADIGVVDGPGARFEIRFQAPPETRAVRHPRGRADAGSAPSTSPVERV
jgi:two-component system, OmpR family, sensor kinase